MEPYFSLFFTLFFDLILLVSLVYYYRRLGYRYLKFGALALAMEMLAQTSFYASMYSADTSLPIVIGGIGKIAYTTLLLACIADIVGRAVPLLIMSTAVVVHLFIVLAIQIGSDFGMFQWIMAELPAIAVMITGLYWLVRSLSKESIAIPCMVGLLCVHLGFKLLMPILAPNAAIFDLLFFFNAVVVMLLAVALLMATSERMIADIASQKDRLEDYKQQKQRLELQVSQAQKLESLGLLAGGIAHDFNNMLTSILGYASLVMSKLPTDSEIRKDIYMIMSGARQAVGLTSQMLIYAGKGAIEFEAVDISKVVDDMANLMRSVVPRKVRLVQKLSRDLPALRGDKVQMGQVVMNLVANAADAVGGDSGSVEISTGLAEVDDQLLGRSYFGNDLEPGAYLYLKVQDDGIGMDEEQLARIFDPFYSEKSSGRGLGLSSLSGIVRQHGGFIRVDSTPSEGSCFTVYFPVVAWQGSSMPEGVKPETDHGRLHNRVLLAEDDSRIRALVTSILQSASYELTTAEDGKEALRIFEQEPGSFDLLVLDCTMPKLLGTDVYKRIRAGGIQVPVVLISGYHQEQVIRDISKDPNAYFIKKPFSVDDFLDHVTNALTRKERSLSG